jgi:hypothetical protein
LVNNKPINDFVKAFNYAVECFNIFHCSLLLALCFVSCYILFMTVEQTVEIPKDQRYDSAPLPGGSYNTLEEALQAAVEKAADPYRKPISRFFGKHKGIFGGDGVAYQRNIRDEWD